MLQLITTLTDLDQQVRAGANKLDFPTLYYQNEELACMLQMLVVNQEVY
jgi:hypothetical protein